MNLMTAVVITGWVLFGSISFAQGEDSLYGFWPEESRKQHELESRFDTLLKADHLRDWMKRMTARPHHVGSPGQKENAEWIAGLFQSWGYQTQVEQFEVLFPIPQIRLLEMIYPEKFSAQLSEPPLEIDVNSKEHSEQLPVYNAYSRDGDVTAELVYVNYGLPGDYEELKHRGIDVKGKIVIARYGASWRGVKPKVAAEHGAIGCIIFSDPAADGYSQGDVYPKGGWRNGLSAQRGSVLDTTRQDGDPLTPFDPAFKNANRISREEAPGITRIPVLPLSYQDALPLLRNLGGQVVPVSWRGGLPIPYHFGPGPAKVHLKLQFDWNLTSIYDVIARMPGTEFPDDWVIRGNHYDAWVYGATDPVSGIVSLLEEARAVSELAKSGWRPKRTLIYAAWDGEEPGLLGSTEWVEAHYEELQQKAVAYINSDSTGRGFFFVEGSQTLEKFLNQVIRNVSDPQKGISVRERLRAYLLMEGPPELKKTAQSHQDLPLRPGGSGSDHSPFLQFAGIASLYMFFNGETEYGQYHSAYDSFDHYIRFMDPKFEYGIALAKTAGRCMLRFANANILPFEFEAFSKHITSYVTELENLTARMREETDDKNRNVQQRIYESFSDSRKPLTVPEVLPPVPHLNFSPLKNAAENLERCASELKDHLDKTGAHLSVEKLRDLNGILKRSERALTRKNGLPGRPWFRHQIYAPSVYGGYEGTAIPSVAEAIEQRNWKLAEEQIQVVADTLEQLVDQIKKAKDILAN
ncbi:M28 family peptidase [bacterium]|nr:M28 family peptidase [bacterium]